MGGRKGFYCCTSVFRGENFAVSIFIASDLVRMTVVVVVEEPIQLTRTHTLLYTTTLNVFTSDEHYFLTHDHYSK